MLNLINKIEATDYNQYWLAKPNELLKSYSFKMSRIYTFFKTKISAKQTNVKDE